MVEVEVFTVADEVAIIVLVAILLVAIALVLSVMHAITI